MNNNGPSILPYDISIFEITVSKHIKVLAISKKGTQNKSSLSKAFRIASVLSYNVAAILLPPRNLFLLVVIFKFATFVVKL